ncbi:MAG TPA: hypothetical protein VMG40_08060 [Bryobacteraceae bacterium]|nr:hypothetical protein [Bryobacteraceae bacterium]
MLHSIHGLTSTNALNSLTNTQPQTQTASTGNSAFAEQLADAIEGVLQQSGNGSQYDINIETGQGPSGNQFTITVTQEGGTGNLTTPSAGATSATPSSSSASASTSSSSSSTSGATLSAAQLATMTPADAYWAEQPAAVQQLRYMPYDQRQAYADQLATQGYVIDQEIMVDGQDPLAVMIHREMNGYTWVPSLNQPTLEEGPGFDEPGLTPYNPNEPPAGSVQVSTAFALGTDLAADPLVSAADAQTYILDQAGASSAT